MAAEGGQVKGLNRGARLIVTWLALVLGFLATWQYLAREAPKPKPAAGDVQDPALR